MTRKKALHEQIEWRGPYDSNIYVADAFPQFQLRRETVGKKREWWVQCDTLNVYERVKASSPEEAKSLSMKFIAAALKRLSDRWLEMCQGAQP